MNILDVALESIWDSLDDVVFVLIALSGLYWLIRSVARNRDNLMRFRSDPWKEVMDM